MPDKIQAPLPSHPGAGVAQLVEQRFRKPQVARSIRVAGSTLRFARTAGLLVVLSV